MYCIIFWDTLPLSPKLEICGKLKKTIRRLKCVSKNIKSDAQSSLHFFVSHLISCLSNTVAC